MTKESPTGRRLFIAALATSIAGYLFFEQCRSRPGSTDPFRFAPSQPFHLLFGRGSAVDGLETIVIYPDGKTILNQRVRDDRWERAVLKLTPDALNLVTQSVLRNELSSLDNEYHRDDIYDGRQWELLIRQAGREKGTYFNNNFPEAIVRFSRELDAIISNAGTDKLEWLPSARNAGGWISSD